MMKRSFGRLSVVGTVLLLAAVSGCKTRQCSSNPEYTKDYICTTNNRAITITKYTGSNNVVIIPCKIDGLPVTSIGSKAFFECTNLTSVALPDGVISIGSWAFTHTGLSSVIIPNSVTNIGEWAFAGCYSLSSVIIPCSVTSIGGGAFDECTILTSVTIPDSVASIGAMAFARNGSLTGITIPNNVTNIGSMAFVQCDNLTGITVNAGNSFYSSLDGVLFNKGKSMLIQYPGGKGGGYTISDSVTNIGDIAFVSCTNLTSVTIGSGVTRIEDSAFSFCPRLASVYFLGNAPRVGPDVFDGTTNVTVYYLPGTTGWGPEFCGRPAMLWTNAPSGMVLIPAGTNNGIDPDSSIYNLTLTAPLYMDKYEVTKAKWDEVYNWAITNGYSFDNTGGGKAANHLDFSLSWDDCVKWCNARSEKERRSPAYYTTSAKSIVYKTGQPNIDDSCVNWNSGYRLPTENEWEYAARGGVVGMGFRWGGTFDHDKAACYKVPFSYEAGENGYGLCDMAGNVWEWCWDWAPGWNGSARIQLGDGVGGLDYYYYNCRVACRGDWSGPYIDGGIIRFRTVLPADQ